MQRRAAALFTMATVACTTTERIDSGALAALAGRRPSSHSLLLESPSGDRIRLGPRSKVRLLLIDGRSTAWIPAERLAVTRDGRVSDGLRQMHLDQVESVEVDNIDGVKTYFVTAGVVGVVAALIAWAVISGDGDGAMPSSGSDRPTAGPSQRRLGIGSALYLYDDPWLHPGRPGYIPLYFGSDAPPEDEGLSATQLFTPGAVRRSTFAPLLQLEGGFGFDERTGGGFGVGGGFALYEMFELSGGVRFARLTDVRETLGYARIGGNFPFEAGDVFGAPIALDIAFSPDRGFAQMRVVWGVRWRFQGQFELSLLPVNPTLTELENDTYWDFPTSLQLSYRF
ncbi:MAG: hypothetical protein AAFN74_05290 [Myxococcota bacterium]